MCYEYQGQLVARQMHVRRAAAAAAAGLLDSNKCKGGRISGQEGDGNGLATALWR
jgi:hypothetical protein